MTYGIHSAAAPKADGSYSQGAAAARYVFVSGQIGENPETGELAAEDMANQTRQAILNMRAILAEIKLDLDDVVKVTAYVTDLDQVPQMDEACHELFSSPRPARTCVQVSGIRKGALIELECIACR